MFFKPQINNDIYNEDPDGWWNKDSFLNILETGIQPVRSEYLFQCIGNKKTKINDSLDIGCGGGILTEKLTTVSEKTYGIDISQASLLTAKNHAIEQGLDIDYRQAPAEKLPFLDNSFDLITCCDVYDTINRTVMSYLSVITIAQDFPLTRFAPKNAHVWHKFIRPDEFLPLFESHGLKSVEQIGMAPSVNSLTMLWYILQTKYNGLDFATFGAKTQFKTSNNKSISYLGHCIKQ